VQRFHPRARRHAALYTREQYLERIADETAKRDISLTTDIIVGFPGETEKSSANPQPARHRRIRRRALAQILTPAPTHRRGTWTTPSPTKKISTPLHPHVLSTRIQKRRTEGM
jgi:hypothetical protein